MISSKISDVQLIVSSWSKRRRNGSSSSNVVVVVVVVVVVAFAGGRSTGSPNHKQLGDPEGLAAGQVSGLAITRARQEAASIKVPGVTHMQ